MNRKEKFPYMYKTLKAECKKIIDSWRRELYNHDYYLRHGTELDEDYKKAMQPLIERWLERIDEAIMYEVVNGKSNYIN